jgi:hypothetical protein
MIALGLSATPVLACGIVGAIVVFHRRLRQGEFIELAGRRGRVREVTLLEVAVEDENGCEVRIPHVVSLWSSTRLMGLSPPISVELVVDPGASHTKLQEALVEAAGTVGGSVSLELVSVDADGALYRVALNLAPSVAAAPIPTNSKRTRSSSGRTTLPGPIPAPRITTVSSAQLSALLVDALKRAGIALGRRSVTGRT